MFCVMLCVHVSCGVLCIYQLFLAQVVLALWARKYEWEVLDKNIKWEYFPLILPKGKLPVAFRQKS